MMDIYGKNYQNYHLLLICICYTLAQQINGIDVNCSNGGTELERYTCLCPGGLTGDYCEHNLYISFDFGTLGNLRLMEGTQQDNFVPLLRGQLNEALSLMRGERQWIDLGFHPEVCLTHRYICPDGTALSLWLNIVDCRGEGGIMVTEENGNDHQTGFNMYCTEDSDEVLYSLVRRRARYLSILPFTPNRWFHVVFNYSPPNDEIQVYYDGTLVERRPGLDVPFAFIVPANDTKIVIGRRYTEVDGAYSSLMMDEVLLFNFFLDQNKIQKLSL